MVGDDGSGIEGALSGVVHMIPTGTSLGGVLVSKYDSERRDGSDGPLHQIEREFVYEINQAIREYGGCFVRVMVIIAVLVALIVAVTEPVFFLKMVGVVILLYPLKIVHDRLFGRPRDRIETARLSSGQRAAMWRRYRQWEEARNAWAERCSC